MENFEKFRCYDNDGIFILKENKLLSDKEYFHKVLEWQWSTYNHTKKEFEVSDHGDFSFFYHEDLMFDNSELKVLLTPKDRLKYAFASLHEDSQIEAVLRKHFPTIQDFHITPMRGTRKCYLKHWMKRYNFTLEDFLFNDKFIVISDGPQRVIDKMFDLGLVDEDKVENCSLWEDD